MHRLIIVIALFTGFVVAPADAQEAPPPTKHHGAPALLPESRAVPIDFASGDLLEKVEQGRTLGRMETER